MDAPLLIDGAHLSLADVADVARADRVARLDPAARARMQASLGWVEAAASGALSDEDADRLAIYGVNTGYGSLARVRIPEDQARRLSWNLVRSHAAGVGDPAPHEVVRAMMLLRANALAKGASGCRPALVETLLGMLEHDVVPEVPELGSCGSSGDLAPLCHLGLVLFRGAEDDPAESGWAWHGGERLRGADAMARVGLPRVEPGPKEGLAISNGAQLTTAFAALACIDADQLVRAAEVAAALSWEAVRGVTRALHPGVHALRPYAGAIATADDLRRLLHGSELVDSMPDKVQDAYAIRCTPQVLGAVRDGITFAAGQIQVEVNAATDNPLILLDADGPNKAYSAGLFHGEPVGMAADHLKLALCELAALAERRLYRLTTGSLSARLPPLLIRKDRPGLGLMVPQTTAAALVAENRALAWPASADSIPTCEDQEDLVAMSTTAARRARQVLGNARQIVAIELWTAASGLRHRLQEAPGLQLGAGAQAALPVIEQAIAEGGELPSDTIATLDGLIADGSLVRAVEDAVGPLTGVLP